MRTSIFLLLCVLIAAPACNSASQLDPSELIEMTINDLQEGYANGDFTIEEVTHAYLDRIERLDENGPALNSIININANALDRARALDKAATNGDPTGPLHGVVVVLKDNVDMKGMATTAGARIMQKAMPRDDAFITQKLQQAGAVILGKANLSEWANFHSSFSSSGWSGLGGQTRNPYDTTRNPCGSSAGSGVAVSANLTTVAIGTETNGSITCPSTANGIVGIKPTVGLLSRDGIIPISFTQDTPGPMARTVTDAAITLGAMTGVDGADRKTAASEGNRHTDYTQFLDADGLNGKRIGFWTGPLGNNHRVDSLTHRQVRLLEQKGATVIEIDAMSSKNVGGDSFQVLLYEFKDGLNAYLASLGDQAPVENIGQLVDSTLADSVEMHYFDHDLLITASKKGSLEETQYKEALERMLRFSQAKGIDSVMAAHNLDAIVAPTGGPAWKTDLTNGDNFSLSSSSPAARAGYPNITVPMGFIDGLPVGLSFFGPAWSEPTLLEIAYGFEQSTTARRAPDLSVQ